MVEGTEREFTQMTKTCGSSSLTEHARFLAVLTWIWTKFSLCFPDSIPPHVANAFSNEDCCGKGDKAGLS